MADHTESELLSCPFCGRQPAICVLEDEPGGSPFGYWLNCLCGAQTQERRTEAEAVEAWNRRVLPTLATEGQPQPVAWRWRPKGDNTDWIYNPALEWLEMHKSMIEAQPLYASPPSSELREALGDRIYDQIHKANGYTLNDGQAVRKAIRAALSGGKNG